MPTVRKLPLCLTNGVHAPGSPWAAECPLRPGGAWEQRRSAGRASGEARRQRKGGKGPAGDGARRGQTPA